MSSTTTSNGSRFVPEAVRNVLTTASEDDCVTIRYEGDEGPFDIQVANFADGRWLNVCNFPDRPSAWKQIFGDPDPHPYAERLTAESELEVADSGSAFVALELPDEDPEAAIEACRETARLLGANLASEQHVKSQTIHAGGWRDWLLEKIQRGDRQ